MRSFRCRGRDSFGQPVEKNLTGADRTDVLHQLQGEGITPISVTEGLPPTPSGSKKYLRYFLVALAVLLLAIVCSLIAGKQKKPLRETKKAHVSGEAKKAAPKNIRPSSPQTVKTEKQKPNGLRKSVQESTSNLSPPGKNHPPNSEQEHPQEEKKAVHPSGFQNASDQLLAMALSVPEGHDMPPLPIPQGEAMDTMFLNSLTNKIIIYPDDSPEVIKLKERVADAKEELARRYEGGESIANILKDYQAAVKETAAIRTDAILQIRRIRQEEGDDAAEKTRREINTALEQEGIPIIPGRGRSRGRGRQSQQ